MLWPGFFIYYFSILLDISLAWFVLVIVWVLFAWLAQCLWWVFCFFHSLPFVAFIAAYKLLAWVFLSLPCYFFLLTYSCLLLLGPCKTICHIWNIKMWYSFFYIYCMPYNWYMHSVYLILPWPYVYYTLVFIYVQLWGSWPLHLGTQDTIGHSNIVTVGCRYIRYEQYATYVAIFIHKLNWDT